MSTALRTSARAASVSVPRDPEVTALVNARRNRGVRSVEPKTDVLVSSAAPSPSPVPAKDVPVKTAKAKARAKTAARAKLSLDPETGATVLTPAPKAKVAKKSIKSAKRSEPKAPSVKRPKLTGYDKRQDGSLSARDLPCLCGCSQPTVTNDARFISGHDAKMRQTILTSSDDAKERADAIPSIVRPFFDNGETVAGLRLNAGKIVDVKATKSVRDDSDDSE